MTKITIGKHSFSIFALNMTNWKDLLAMSRHERRGALVVIVLLALAVAVRFVVSGNVDSRPDEINVTEQAFVSRVDSMTAASDSVAKQGHSKRRSHKNKARTARRQPAERPLNPVPSF